MISKAPENPIVQALDALTFSAPITMAELVEARQRIRDMSVDIKNVEITFAGNDVLVRVWMSDEKGPGVRGMPTWAKTFEAKP